MSSSTFGSSALVRLFAHWGVQSPAAAAGGADLAQRLGAWVGAFDAITLQSTHRALQADAEAGAAPAGPASLAEQDRAALAKALAQARATLGAAIERDPALPNEFSYTPYKRRHLELQAKMERAIAGLRTQAREALARGTPPLRRLAALDAALDAVVSRREQALLAGTVGLLQQRFEALRRTGQLGAGATPPPTELDTRCRQPGGWLHTFEQDWHQALHAELALRLEPVTGLAEACGISLDTHFPT